MTPRARHAGFTLVEAIIVIVIAGIVAATVGVFIRHPVEGYVDSVRRAQLSDQADVALRRMARDIRLALPNSLRLTSSGGRYYLELIITKSGGRYRDESDSGTGKSLSWLDSTNKQFDIMGPAPAIALNDWIVVNDLSQSPADAYDDCSVPQCNRAQVQDITTNLTTNVTTITLSSNPFAQQTPPLPSPNARFFVVPNDQQAVTYSCPISGSGLTGDLIRHRGYGFNTTQSIPPGTAFSAPLAGRAQCVIEYEGTSSAYGRNGLVYIQLTLSDSSGESVQLFQQIHVDNTP